MLSVLTLACPLGPRAQQMPLFAVAESRDQGSSLSPGSCLLHVPVSPSVKRELDRNQESQTQKLMGTRQVGSVGEAGQVCRFAF